LINIAPIVEGVAVGILMREIKPGMKSYITRKALRTPFILTRMYLVVEILHKMFLDLAGLLILPFHSLMSQFIVLVCFILIWYADHLIPMDTARLLIIMAALQGTYCTFLEISGRFHVKSENLLKSFPNHKACNNFEKKYLLKFTRACKPLFIGTPGYFRIQRLTVLTFLRGIMVGTLDMILTAKNS